MNSRPIAETAKTRPLTVFAQDPSICGSNGQPLVSQITVPAEQLAPGPTGYRVRVVDYDASTGTLYRPRGQIGGGNYLDPFEGIAPKTLIENPTFHQQNVYAISMRILGEFERALGRRVSWRFKSHQLKILPHAFREANAFYSRGDEALMFGYYAVQSDQPDAKDDGGVSRVYTCLSHDVVAHETAHALLDGIRERLLLPSMPDQAAFHEGFSDVVALLSVLSDVELVDQMLLISESEKPDEAGSYRVEPFARPSKTDGPGSGSIVALVDSFGAAGALFTLGEQMAGGRGDTVSKRGQALRDSLRIEASPTLINEPQFQSPHRRGELLVAATMRAMLEVTRSRCLRIGIDPPEETARALGTRLVSRRQLAKCLAESAANLLRIAIRGLDYLPPVHVTFGEYLTGLLTADYELVGNDSKYGYRESIRRAFLAYGIAPVTATREGVWPRAAETGRLAFERTDHAAMMLDRDEMFRFLWENRHTLGLSDDYYTNVGVIAPTVRSSPDGAIQAETVVEYTQSARLRGTDLIRKGFIKPPEMPDDEQVELFGGGTLIFDARGQLKYHIVNPFDDRVLQNQRLAYLWGTGKLRPGRRQRLQSLAHLHQHRQHGGRPAAFRELW